MRTRVVAVPPSWCLLRPGVTLIWYRPALRRRRSARLSRLGRYRPTRLGRTRYASHTGLRLTLPFCRTRRTEILMISAPCGRSMLRRRPRRSTRARLMRCVVLSFATLNRARKAAAAAAAVARGSTPAPVKAMWLTPEAALVATSRLAVRGPAAEGTNWTPIAQAAPDGMTAPPQVLLTTRKSAAAGPLTPMADTARLDAPAGSGTPKLVTVAPCGAVGLPSAWLPKSRPAGPWKTGTGGPASLPATVNRSVVPPPTPLTVKLLPFVPPVTVCGVTLSPMKPGGGAPPPGAHVRNGPTSPERAPAKVGHGPSVHPVSTLLRPPPVASVVIVTVPNGCVTV